MADDFFPARPQATPSIYAYEDTNPQYSGLLKVGYTTLGAGARLRQIYPVVMPGTAPYVIHLEESAMRADGSAFTDRDVHRLLRKRGVQNPDGEWFRCSPDDVRAAVVALVEGKDLEVGRSRNFSLRPEQEQAVEKTAAYFASALQENRNKPPHFLWNAKMRFGKTFAAYMLAKRMGWKRILVLTYKPAVQSAWEEDVKTHVEFDSWQFVSSKDVPSTGEPAHDKNWPVVCFGSFQDYLGKNTSTGGIKTKNEWVHAINWDCVILDEYHYGAWRENAKYLFEKEDQGRLSFEDEDAGEEFRALDEDSIPITTGAYLYLSGTPFRAITSGEFIEEQIFNWTYSDEQRAKRARKGPGNPYASLPRMVLLTYQLPDEIREIASKGEFDGFDLNAFFSATGSNAAAKFKYEDEVQKWLDLIRGSYALTTVDNLKLGAKKPPLPYSDVRLLEVLNHTIWFLPNVAACHAMANLLKKRQNRFYQDYRVVVAAGTEAGIGMAALKPVLDAMDNPLETKTITLTCGKLTTGVTVRPWTGILMLRNSSSPETYFQAAFRVQSPWTITNPDGQSPNREEVLKHECYVFDFAPDRALRQIADYSCRLNVDETTSPEKKVEEFIDFLPVLAYDGSAMKQIDAAGILDMAMSGTTATLLARRWESALLVNVDNDTLRRLLGNEEAMRAIMNIEGFRSLNQDIETIINKSDAVKKTRKGKNGESLTEGEKKQLSDDEREYRSKRKEIQEKLIKFATRIPVFMFLTDYRERTLRDVITKLEPDLFKRVTGLNVRDFELLVSLNLFNSALMNDAVFKFKRYEDASLVYTGLARHDGELIGLYDTVVSRADAMRVFECVTPYVTAEQPSPKGT
ncbi:MAG: GIY-YIG nuclease family protein [Fimbriimonadaceae bacterium]|nr:GIY-YIG nuclease family protein [Fimbriimonadaceae bacterium]QYK57407.1 MAG: GIY-YIG nuclease family protein [Fimbriimonadaceae bacterium]